MNQNDKVLLETVVSEKGRYRIYLGDVESSVLDTETETTTGNFSVNGRELTVELFSYFGVEVEIN